MHDVFISYVQGQKIAETMKAALEKRGLSVFIDKELAMGAPLVPVSYTHLTLPTIRLV